MAQPEGTTLMKPENTSIGSIKDARQARSKSWFLVTFSLLVALFLFALNSTIAANVQPGIIETLGESEKLPWISVAFALGGIATDLSWGQAYGRFENKALLLASVLIFDVGSAVCGAAPTLNTLIVGRAICGIGGVGIYLGVINTVTLQTSKAERPLYLGLAGVTWAMGTILGPIISSAIADSSATWRWALYNTLCIGGVVAPAFIFLLPSADPSPNTLLLIRVRSLDLLGGILGAGAIATLIIPLSLGGTLYAWSSARIIALFAITAILWLALILQQHFSLGTTPETRLFPASQVQNQQMHALFAELALAQFAATLPIYVFPLIVRLAHADDTFTSDPHLLPFVLILALIIATVVLLHGPLTTPLRLSTPWLAGSIALAAIGAALMYIVDADPEVSRARILGYSGPTALGAGLFLQASLGAAQLRVSESVEGADAGVNEDPAAMRSSEPAPFVGVARVGAIVFALTLSNGIFLHRGMVGIVAHLTG
ncbi:major facilitator superfamily domain-containing protein [Aspergillus carlsbadensis]|nr:major facilitator superfamily domain-containing protein [Aspergillus carlsbadensis]